jgi:enterobacteria phage integrase
MSPAKRMPGRRDWPENLKETRDGYYSFLNPKTKKYITLGRIPLEDAIAQVREVNLMFAKARDPNSLLNRLDVRADSFAAWLDEYQVIYVNELEISGKPPAAKTLENRKSVLKQARIQWGHIALADITTKEVAAFLARIQAQGKHSTASKMRSVLQHVFQVAEANGRIERGHNPVTVTTAITAKTKRARLTLETFQAIYDSAAAFDPWVQNSMLLALVTAQRREDIGYATFKAAKGSNIWVDGDWLMVQQGKGGNKLRIPTGLTLQINGGITVGMVVARCRDNVLSPHMIHHTRSYPNCPAGSAVRLDLLSIRFAEARDLSGLSWAEKTPPTFHEIRSLSERLYKAQGTVDTQGLLGHKSANMTAVYDDARGAEFKTVIVKT